MKKYYLGILILFTTFTVQASKIISYRAGIDVGTIGYGQSIIVSPFMFQLTPDYQLGVLGVAFQKYNFDSDMDDVYAAARNKWSSYTIDDITLKSSNREFSTLIQLLTMKYDIEKRTLANKYVPFVKSSLYINPLNNDFYNRYSVNVTNPDYDVPSRLMLDIKMGLSLYSKERGANLSLYIGAAYGAFTTVDNVYTVDYSYNKYGNTTESSTTLHDYGTVKLPILFNCGLQFEFGGKGAFGYGKYVNYTDQQLKDLRKRRWNTTLSVLNTIGTVLVVAGQVAGAVNNDSYVPDLPSSNSSYSSQSSGKSSSYYQNEYSRWERVAEKNYNALTNLGTSITYTDGSKSGNSGQGSSSSSYLAKKNLYRDAQKEMIKIRKEAARNGITITKSDWETNPVSY